MPRYNFQVAECLGTVAHNYTRSRRVERKCIEMVSRFYLSGFDRTKDVHVQISLKRCQIPDLK